jgi:hypothetical protein
VKLIFSHITSLQPSYTNEIFVKMSALSNYYAQKHGFETIFFGDSQALKNFGKIKYNHFFELSNNYLNNFPKCLWAISKWFALSSMNEPCLHIDHDLFLVNSLNDNFLKNDIFCFHDELFVLKFYKRINSRFKIKPKEISDVEVYPYNCGLFGGQDINTIKNSINFILNFISNNINYVIEIDKKYKYPISMMCLVEQVWLFQVLKNNNKIISTLLKVKDWGDFKKQSFEKRYIHFMFDKTSSFQEVERALFEKNIKY